MAFLFFSDLGFLAVLQIPFAVRSIIATMEDISDLLALNFHLTSKEEDDVDVGGSSASQGSHNATFDVVG